MYVQWFVEGIWGALTCASTGCVSFKHWCRRAQPSPQHLIVPAPGLCEDAEVACYCPSSPQGCTLRGHNREQNRWLKVSVLLIADDDKTAQTVWTMQLSSYVILNLWGVAAVSPDRPCRNHISFFLQLSAVITARSPSEVSDFPLWHVMFNFITAETSILLWSN